MAAVRTLYFDAFSGASGDMILGALIDLGGDYAGLRSALAGLGRGRFELRRRKVVASTLAATKIEVRITRRDEEERSFREIAAVIRRSRLKAPVKDLAIEIFRRLCQAEGAVHGLSFDRVHLHEAGAMDAIADICGAAWLLDALAPDRIFASPLNVGSGTIECRHGTYPVPGPATARLLRGVPIYAEGAPGERVTPTGAAILSTVVSEYGPLPPIVARAIGHGAGDRVFPDRPNVLRAILGETAPGDGTGATGAAPLASWTAPLPAGSGEVLVIEATIDDMNPQNYGFLLERALAEGALEVFFTPIIMKKDRPGTQVTLLVPPGRFETLARLIFRETTTIGFRYRRESRRELDRALAAVKTPYGSVRLKISSERGEILHVQAEYEDCRRIAASRDVPLKEVQRAALAAWVPRRTSSRKGSRGAPRPSARSVPKPRRKRTKS